MRALLLGALLLCALPSTAAAQYVEGRNCTQTLFWFAEVNYRPPAKNNYGMIPKLMLFNGLEVVQQVTVRVRPDQPAGAEHTYTLEPKQRVGVDIGAMMGYISGESTVEVEFSSVGVADLKVWVSATMPIPVVPLPLCR